MFKEKVNARTDGRTTDNGPWHKLAGLRPVELKMYGSYDGICVWKDGKILSELVTGILSFFPLCFQKASASRLFKRRFVLCYEPGVTRK